MADKSNVMRYGHDLWQRCFAAVAAEYPQIEASHLFVDALTMQMVRKPEMFEVIVTTNMFGDIVTDLGAALQGGLGVAASANLHPGRISLFEPVPRFGAKIHRHRQGQPHGCRAVGGIAAGEPRPRGRGRRAGGWGKKGSPRRCHHTPTSVAVTPRAKWVTSCRQLGCQSTGGRGLTSEHPHRRTPGGVSK